MPPVLSGPVRPCRAARLRPSPAAATPIDLNTASQPELEALPGIGPTTAQAILAYRDQHGPFASVDDLGEVQGIGPTRLDALRELVRV